MPESSNAPLPELNSSSHANQDLDISLEQVTNAAKFSSQKASELETSLGACDASSAEDQQHLTNAQENINEIKKTMLIEIPNELKEIRRAAQPLYDQLLLLEKRFNETKQIIEELDKEIEELEKLLKDLDPTLPENKELYEKLTKQILDAKAQRTTLAESLTQLKQHHDGGVQQLYDVSNNLKQLLGVAKKEEENAQTTSPTAVAAFLESSKRLNESKGFLTQCKAILNDMKNKVSSWLSKAQTLVSKNELQVGRAKDTIKNLKESKQELTAHLEQQKTDTLKAS